MQEVKVLPIYNCLLINFKSVHIRWLLICSELAYIYSSDSKKLNHKKCSFLI